MSATGRNSAAWPAMLLRHQHMLNKFTLSLRSQRGAPAGFTLIELVIVLGVSSMLLLSLSAALSATLSTTAEVSDQLSAWHVVSDALLKMEGELRAATSVIATQVGRVCFYVPDITGDDAPDLVEYNWGGNAGDALTRSVNSDTPAALLPAAQKVAFSYNYRQYTPMTIAAGAEDLAVVPAMWEQASQAQAHIEDIRGNAWRAQRFTAQLDTDRTDAVEFYMQNGLEILFSGSNLNVELHDIEAGRTIASTTVSCSILGMLLSPSKLTATMSWHNPEGSGLKANKEYRWVFRPSGSGYAGSLIVYLSGSSSPPNDGTMFEYSTNNGASWSNFGNSVDAPFTTRGTRLIEYGVNTTQTQWHLRRVCIHLESGTGKNAVKINTAIRLAELN